MRMDYVDCLLIYTFFWLSLALRTNQFKAIYNKRFLECFLIAEIFMKYNKFKLFNSLFSLRPDTVCWRLSNV